MVAGQDHDGARDAGQQLAGGLDVGPLDAHVVEEVAGDHDHVDRGFFAEVEHVLKGAQGGLQIAVFAARFGGVGAQMHIGGVEQAQGMRGRRGGADAVVRRIDGGHTVRSPDAHGVPRGLSAE